jgi:hypothetical protein
MRKLQPPRPGLLIRRYLIELPATFGWARTLGRAAGPSTYRTGVGGVAWLGSCDCHWKPSVAVP